MSKEITAENKKDIPGWKQLEDFLNASCDFRYNEVTGKVEGKTKKQERYTVVTDYRMNSLLRAITKAGIQCRISQLRGLLISNFTPVFNPFKTYLAALPPWDEKIDHIQALAETVITTRNSLWHTCFKKWFVAMVASLMDDKIVNHTVIVFSGEQGLGKTTWILNLIPKELSEYCFSGTINPGNKDTLIQLSECMLINLDELENLNRTELGSIKETITKSSIRIRRPYGFSSETLPRRASFAGSVNAKEFLSDTTGSRRFLCFEVTSIDYNHDLDLGHVYAQALNQYQSGFKYWFGKEEIEDINKNNEQYRSMSVEEELLLTYFEPADQAAANCYFSTTELIDWISQKVKIGVNDVAKQRMGRALRAHKFLRIKRGHRYVYALKEKDIEQVGYLTRYSPGTDQFEVRG